MSTPPPAYAPSSPQPLRSAIPADILAATEARLRQQSSPSSSSDPNHRSAEDVKKKLEKARIVTKDIMGGNHYTEALGCMETLATMAKNILDHPTEQKYASIKASNTMVKSKILSIKGGEDFLVKAMGFRTKTIQFVPHYHIDPFPPSQAALRELRLSLEVLEAHLPEARERLTHASTSAHLLSLRESDSSRRAAALAEIEEDRERVRVRGERERVGREARERVEAEKRGREERERERGRGEGGE